VLLPVLQANFCLRKYACKHVVVVVVSSYTVLALIRWGCCATGGMFCFASNHYVYVVSAVAPA
jgi:hypothetical protein